MGWVRARWHVPDDGSASECIDEATGFRRQFIPAKLSDNPFLRDTDYAVGLKTLAKADYKALALGRWDSFSGGVFDEWDPGIHTCAPFDIRPEWPTWRAADDGYAAYAATLWFSLDRTHDRIYVVSELYQKRMTPQVFAQAVLAIDRQLAPYRLPLKGVIDSSAFVQIGQGFSRPEEMNQYGTRWRPLEKGPGSRLAGLHRIHSRLAARSDGTPGMQFFSTTCKNLIRTLPMMTFSERDPEDLDSACESHLTDALSANRNEAKAVRE